MEQDQLKTTAAAPAYAPAHAQFVPPTAQDAEEEGMIWNGGSSALNVKLSGPAGLAFDAEGNLYITERDSAVIRKVKKWW